MKRLQRGSFAVLREAVLSGEVERSIVPSLTGYEERAARLVTAGLVERGMLTATTHRTPLRLAFPADVAERWFSNLYPANAGSGPQKTSSSSAFVAADRAPREQVTEGMSA